MLARWQCLLFAGVVCAVSLGACAPIDSSCAYFVVLPCTPQPSPNPASDIRTLPIKPAQTAAVNSARPMIGGGGARQGVVRPGPPPPSAPEGVGRLTPSATLSGEAVNLTIEQMPLPAFINTVFGDTLHLSYAVDPRIAQRTDPVTLRTGGPRPPNDILALTRQVLRDYGIQITFEGPLARIVPNEVLMSQAPDIISGRSTPEIAESLRPIFQYVTVASVSSADMATWLTSAFGTKIKVTPVVAGNGLLLLGLPQDILTANEAIRTFDQPRFAGHRSVRIEPAFWSAGQLADKLVDILRAEGYNATSTLEHPAAIVVLSLKPSNSLVAFAADAKTLAHVADWAHDLDRPSQTDPQLNLFYYAVQNTTAESLAGVLNAVLQGASSAPKPASTTEATAAQPGGAAPPAAGGAASAAATVPGGASQPLRIVTDAARNALIFQGSAEEFGQLRPLIESLDQAPRAAIIEATVVEVTLSNDDKLGVEGTISYGLLGNKMAVSDTQTGIGAGGFNYTIFNSAGAARGTLNAFASDSRTKVLSTPKLLARSGAEARIQVGAQVPIVTQQATSSQSLITNGNSGILQNIQYRDTGVILTVRPTIYAGNQIDLQIKQEVSEPLNNGPNGPSFNNRTVSTQLSLRDGATVLLGGLISENVNDTSAGVPLLKDVPGLGFLFGTKEVSKVRKELFVFITPYIVNSEEEAKRLADIFKQQYEALPQPKSRLLPKSPDYR